MLNAREGALTWRLTSFALPHSLQLILPARACTSLPRHQVAILRQPRIRASRRDELSPQHPCKQQQSPPDGGVFKRRLHTATPGCPCATVRLIVANFQAVFTRRSHIATSARDRPRGACSNVGTRYVYPDQVVKRWVGRQHKPSDIQRDRLATIRAEHPTGSCSARRQAPNRTGVRGQQNAASVAEHIDTCRAARSIVLVAGQAVAHSNCIGKGQPVRQDPRPTADTPQAVASFPDGQGKSHWRNPNRDARALCYRLNRKDRPRNLGLPPLCGDPWPSHVSVRLQSLPVVGAAFGKTTTTFARRSASIDARARANYSTTNQRARWVGLSAAPLHAQAGLSMAALRRTA